MILTTKKWKRRLKLVETEERGRRVLTKSKEFIWLSETAESPTQTTITIMKREDQIRKLRSRKPLKYDEDGKFSKEQILKTKRYSCLLEQETQNWILTDLLITYQAQMLNIWLSPRKSLQEKNEYQKNKCDETLSLRPRICNHQI